MVSTETALPLSVESLRDRIRKLDEDAQQALRESWPDWCPSLLDPAITTEQLERIRIRVVAIENPAPAPEVSDERIAELRDACNALPDDIAMGLSVQAREQGVPQGLRGATAVDESVVADLLAKAQGVVNFRQGRIMGRVAEFDDDPDGHIRHAIIHEATGGRTESSRQVTQEEVAKVEAICDGLSLGTYMLDYDPDGAVSVAVASTVVDRPPTATDQPQAIDWKAVAKEHGTTQAALLRLAREVYKDKGLEPPTKLHQVSWEMYGTMCSFLDHIREAEQVASVPESARADHPDAAEIVAEMSRRYGLPAEPVATEPRITVIEPALKTAPNVDLYMVTGSADHTATEGWTKVSTATEPDASPYVATSAVVVVAHLPSGLRTWCIARSHYDELVALLDKGL